MKYFMVFLLGLATMYIASAYTNIDTTISNATQYIQNIILTSDGNQSGITGIILNGTNGSAYFSGKVGIGTTGPDALLTVQGGMRLIKLTSDPCTNTGDYPEGTLFYDDTDNYYCFCNDAQTAKDIGGVLDCF